MQSRAPSLKAYREEDQDDGCEDRADAVREAIREVGVADGGNDHEHHRAERNREAPQLHRRLRTLRLREEPLQRRTRQEDDERADGQEEHVGGLVRRDERQVELPVDPWLAPLVRIL